MTKQKYKEVLETQYNDVITKIQGVVSLGDMIQENERRGYNYD